MFKVFFTPQRGATFLHLAKNGSTLSINGQAFDLSALAADGDVLAELDSPMAVGPVVRVGDEIQLTLVWPYGISRTEVDETGLETTYTIEMPTSVSLVSDGPATFAGSSAETPAPSVGLVNPAKLSTTAARLAARRAAVWERVKTARHQRRQSGVFAGGHWFHSDDTSRIQQLGLVMMGASIPPGYLWRTIDNGEVPMTQTLAMQIFQAVAASDAAHFAAAKALRAVVEASDNPEAVNIEAGWPAIYTLTP